MTTDTPNEHTSNYGWALWHMREAETASTHGAHVHALLAQARSTLALVDSNESMRDTNPTEMSVWGREQVIR